MSKISRSDKAWTLPQPTFNTSSVHVRVPEVQKCAEPKLAGFRFRVLMHASNVRVCPLRTWMDGDVPPNADLRRRSGGSLSRDSLEELGGFSSWSD